MKPNRNFLTDNLLAFWIDITCKWVQWKIPRGEDWLDSIVSILELDNANGKWKRFFEKMPKSKGKLVKSVQLVYTSRRNNASILGEKRAWNKKLNQIEKSLQLLELKSYPLEGVLEMTQNCNLKCPMCPQSYERLNQQDMPVQVLDKIQPFLPYLDELELFGFGEPFTSKTFFQILDSIPRVEGQEICTTTNGLLLTKEVVERLIQSPLSKIMISLNTLDREIYFKIRGVDGLDNVINNVKQIIKLKSQYRSDTPKIWLYFQMQRDNMHHLPEYVRFAKQLGADGVQGCWLMAYTEDQWSNSIVLDREKTNEMMDKAIELGKELGIPVYLPKKFDLSISLADMDQSEFNDTCVTPWDTFHIINDMTLRPCYINCSNLGQLNGHDFPSLWNGQEYQNFRKSINSDQRQYRCKYCYYKYVHTDNIHCHLVDIKQHYQEVGLVDRLNLPADYSERLNSFIQDLIDGVIPVNG